LKGKPSLKKAFPSQHSRPAATGKELKAELLPGGVRVLSHRAATGKELKDKHAGLQVPAWIREQQLGKN